jgi:Tol biopolymer transport system component
VLRGKSWLAIGVLVLAAVVLPSCNDVINYPAPRIQSLSPTDISAGQPLFNLTVNGFQFAPASIVEWNSTPLITFFQTVNTLTAQVPAALIQNPGAVSVTVFTPQPGGGTTTPLFFTIDPVTTPVPQITSISPTGVVAGSSAFQLFITGSNFVSTSSVTVDGDNRTTTFVNTTSLQVQVTAADVATAGAVEVAVVNPIGPTSAPGGGSSAPVSLMVTNPVPVLTSLSPTSFAAGTTASTALVVNGASLVSNSVIEIDGGERTTIFGGNGQVSTLLAQGDFAAAGVHRVQVVNPGPGGGTSNILTFAVDPTLTHGLPELLDYAFDGSEANQGICGNSCASGTPTLNTAGPGINSTASVVVFASTSTNFFQTQANTGSDIYARTICLTASCVPATTDVSVGPDQTVSNGSSSEPSVDGGAAHVAFTSTASDLVAGVSFAPTNRQVYWMPVCTTSTTSTTSTACPAGELVSLSADGINPGNGDSYNPSISPDGRYVAFVSLATDLVSGLTTLDGKTPQVFLRDTCGGVSTTTTSGSVCTPTTFLISTPDGITPGNGPSSQPNAANLGAYVSFTSTANNLGATAPNPDGAQEIFVRTVCLPTVTGTSTVTTCTGFTSLISTPDGVTPANGSSSESKIASGGRFIVFASTATNLAAGAGPVQQVYLYDTCLSATTGCTPSATLISTPDGSTPGNALSEYPSISIGTSTATATSTAGQFTAFASRASNLGANTQNGVENIFVRKTCLAFSSISTVCTPITVLASQAAGTSPPQANGDSLMPAISGDAHTVAFISSANNLVVPATTNSFANLFLALTSF